MENTQIIGVIPFVFEKSELVISNKQVVNPEPVEGRIVEVLHFAMMD